MATTLEARYAQGLEAEQPKHLSNWNTYEDHIVHQSTRPATEKPCG
jgi:hypothetical protein